MVPSPPQETPPSAPTYQRDGGEGGGMVDLWARPWRAHAFLTVIVKFAGVFVPFISFSPVFFCVRACASPDALMM